jgi:hypothetical protein
MADIELVIKIPEEMYKKIKETSRIISGRRSGKRFDYILFNAVNNGTPLPHPFDLEGLKSDMKALNCGYPYGLDYLLDCLNKRLGITITEADKAEGSGEE